jgi:hypothetical protein
MTSLRLIAVNFHDFLLQNALRKKACLLPFFLSYNSFLLIASGKATIILFLYIYLLFLIYLVHNHMLGPPLLRKNLPPYNSLSQRLCNRT